MSSTMSYILKSTVKLFIIIMGFLCALGGICILISYMGQYHPYISIGILLSFLFFVCFIAVCVGLGFQSK